jgi:glycosyltransferase involved in cell wall biosynthesis
MKDVVRMMMEAEQRTIEKNMGRNKRVSELGWRFVKFLGFLNQSKLPQYYDLCDIFVLPSVHEPWGCL